MSPPDGSSTLSLNDGDADEDRVRAALGLAPQARAGRAAEQVRHRPGREEVAVTVLPRRAEAPDGARVRVAALEAELKTERHERVAAQQALADAQRVIQQLQTKLAHAEMASSEVLQAEQKARQAAEARLKEAVPPPRAAAAPASLPKRRGRPPGKRPVAELPEQEPVEWWLPSYAAKIKRARSKS